jgi:hypothetical protein
MGELLLHKPLMPGKDEIDQVKNNNLTEFKFSTFEDSPDNPFAGHSDREYLARNVEIACTGKFQIDEATLQQH